MSGVRLVRAVVAACAVLLAFSVLLPGCMRTDLRRGGREQDSRLYDTTRIPGRSAADSAKIRKVLASYLGTPYRLGGMSREGIDCSGLACLVYREVGKVRLPRSAGDLMRVGCPVPIAKAKTGDLLFFRWGRLGPPDHVGVYTIDGRFIHASKTLGVIESTLEDDYYLSHFIAARRVPL